MEGRTYRIAQALLTAAAILLAALVQSVYVAAALAGLVLAMAFGRLAFEAHRAKVSRKQLERMMEETPWKLVPGPRA